MESLAEYILDPFHISKYFNASKTVAEFTYFDEKIMLMSSAKTPADYIAFLNMTRCEFYTYTMVHFQKIKDKDLE